MIPLYLLVFLVTAEGIYFFILLGGTSKLEKSELIVVFEGGDKRARAAYELADLGYANAMLISPANEKKLDAYDRSYKPINQIDRVLETKATTTFENALYTSKIIREKGYKSVALITSWDHMPRSYLLLRMMLTGSDVRIRYYSVKNSNIDQKGWYRNGLAWKMVSNEMVETWGSLIELVNYRISGSIPKNSIGKKSLFFRLKGWLLFDIALEKTCH